MRVLVTGTTGVVGSVVVRALRDHGVPAVLTARRGVAGAVPWTMGQEPPPEILGRHWDAIIHTAASTRWTMTRAEAVAANVEPVRALRGIAGRDTHIVHLSTAYLGQPPIAGSEEDDGFDGYRNGYEWSKARCEAELREWHDGPLTIVRPPLIVGRSDTGAIARFSGPYTLLQSLVSGLAAAVVGEPGGFVEIAPVDQVADVAVQAALAGPPTSVETHTIAAGARSMRLAGMLTLSCETINELREAKGLRPISAPPFINARRWHRFFRPFAREHLSPIQNEAVELLGMFESYTSMPAPFTPTDVVSHPEQVLVRSIRWWAEHKPRHVLRDPQPWALVPTG